MTTLWSGDVGASIWSRLVTVKGEPITYYSVSFERSYRDRDGNRKYSKSFDMEHQPKVMEVSKMAHDRLFDISKSPEA
ncbi:MAG: hypothetical protein U0798_04425 [Gemmataceae bacterium]